MSRTDLIEMEGIVTESLSHALFKVKLDNDFEVVTYICGQMRLHYIKILPGDRVKVELSPYDLTRGRITARLDKSNLLKGRRKETAKVTC